MQIKTFCKNAFEKIIILRENYYNFDQNINLKHVKKLSTIIKIYFSELMVKHQGKMLSNSQILLLRILNLMT